MPLGARIALLGTYPPRRCGIATYTADLANALLASTPSAQVDVFAVRDAPGYRYPEIVRHEIPEQQMEAYPWAAKVINRGSYDVLSVQHEYGIFGGDSGRFLLPLLRDVRIPIVSTLHTVLSEPSAEQREVMAEVLALSARVIVMSQRAAEILRNEYRAPPNVIDRIPHGIPNFDPAAAGVMRELLGIDGPMLLTFGLLSPGKGIEFVIEALPAIVDRHPGAVYFVLGATHPNVVSRQGEQYREGLQKLAQDLGVSGNVRFVDQFVTTEELIAYLGAADIYITPYLGRDQITSGTLAYAIGAGKCVISTPYAYAEELLADGRGVLVPFRDAGAIADAVIKIEGDPVASQQMSRKAREYGADMQWPAVGLATMDTFMRASQESQRLTGPLADPAIPRLNLGHFLSMCDDTGMLQHASYTVPNRAEGYCVDDNARALIFSVYLSEDRPLLPEVERGQARFLAFVCDAFNPSNGRFRNFMGFGRNWLEDAGSEDSHGRSLWALAILAARGVGAGQREVALRTFERGSEAVEAMTSPRTWAYAVLAAQELLCAYPLHDKATMLRDTMAFRLEHLYRTFAQPDWPWFERNLTYGNARLPQALIVAGQATGSDPMMEIGLKSLSWLAGRQTASTGVFAPIGTYSFFADQQTSASGCEMFDQQPLEAWDSVSAYLAASQATGDPLWLDEAARAYRWFLGGNMPSVPLYDPSTGGCRDGLHCDRANENQGAESTLSFLCASLEMKRAARLRTDSPAIYRAEVL